MQLHQVGLRELSGMIPETEATYRLGPPGLAREFHLRYLRIIETPIALALLMGVSFFGGIQSAK